MTRKIGQVRNRVLNEVNNPVWKLVDELTESLVWERVGKPVAIRVKNRGGLLIEKHVEEVVEEKR